MLTNEWKLLDDFQPLFSEIRERVQNAEKPEEEITRFLREHAPETSCTIVLRLNRGIRQFEAALNSRAHNIGEQIDQQNLSSADRRKTKMHILHGLMEEADRIAQNDASHTDELMELCSQIRAHSGQMSERRMNHYLSALVSAYSCCIVSRELEVLSPPAEALLSVERPSDKLCAAAVLYLLDQQDPLWGLEPESPEILGVKAAYEYDLLRTRLRFAMDRREEAAVSKAVLMVMKLLTAALVIWFNVFLFQTLGQVLLQSAGFLCGGVVGLAAAAVQLRRLYKKHAGQLNHLSSEAGSALYQLKKPLRSFWLYRAEPVLSNAVDAVRTRAQQAADQFNDAVNACAEPEGECCE